MAPKSIEMFQIGYAPNSWDALTVAPRGAASRKRRSSLPGLAVDGDARARTIASGTG